MAAAHAVKPDSPGYATAAYYGILQQIRAGQAGADKSSARAFLPADQQGAGKAEWEKLIKRAGNSVNYLCEKTLAWAGSHPPAKQSVVVLKAALSM